MWTIRRFMSGAPGRALVLAILVGAISAANALAQSTSGRGDVAVQTSLLNSNASAGLSPGVGGRVTLDLWGGMALDGEATFFPNDDFHQGISVYRRSRTEGFLGVKVGYRGDRVGVFGKFRPGVTRLANRGLGCTGGEQCWLILPVAPVYESQFAIDVGGIVEFYPTSRLVTRIDVGQLVVPNRPPLARCLPACTSSTLATRIGVGVRF
jgi:hypothetical protein